MSEEAIYSLQHTDYRNRIFTAMNYISQYIEREVTLTEIANITSFSPFHFHRIFKAVVGENVAEFTRRLRVELAANRLLGYPEKDVTSIALSCGFSSSQNFAKIFRQRYDASPTEYRKKQANNFQNRSVLNEFEPVLIGNAEKSYLKQVTIQEMPESKAATVRRIGMFPESCENGFKELLTWAKQKTIIGPSKILALYWDNPDITPLDKCRFDCCLTLSNDIDPSDPIFIQKIGGGVWAFCRFETGSDGFRKAWEESFQWLIESGIECRPEPCYEIYYNNGQEHPESKWIFDIAIPLVQS
ncbi:MAG: hypothetical protein ACD_34C00188G0001 [uncultured bacterium]|nr:MAG: hypothetical protein ACD_34C00188G0001 [uncultured bacterium]HCS40851.1 AraC family transcriptional regulator [Anaerolineaceae bacterium]